MGVQKKSPEPCDTRRGRDLDDAGTKCRVVLHAAHGLLLGRRRRGAELNTRDHLGGKLVTSWRRSSETVSKRIITGGGECAAGLKGPMRAGPGAPRYAPLEPATRPAVSSSPAYAREWSSASDDVELLVFDRPGTGATGDDDVAPTAELSIRRRVCMCIERAYSRRRSVAWPLASMPNVWAAAESWEAGMLEEEVVVTVVVVVEWGDVFVDIELTNARGVEIGGRRVDMLLPREARKVPRDDV
jgi:hypothetical protein